MLVLTVSSSGGMGSISSQHRNFRQILFYFYLQVIGVESEPCKPTILFEVCFAITAFIIVSLMIMYASELSSWLTIR